jgi:NAD(P)-dependent dehydrogenase (short-subunit alcohol dehydrogenase family)
MELEGQAAIVTGAGRGIGRATALELARRLGDERPARPGRSTGRALVALERPQADAEAGKPS